VREDRGNRWVLAVFGVIGLLDGWLPAWTDRNQLWVIDGDAMRWFGVVLFAVGGALRIWPARSDGGWSFVPVRARCLRHS
jgi:protein-S-isoprenylcysteine O-methyltransferase Ste14